MNINIVRDGRRFRKWYGRSGHLSQNKVALHLTKCSKRIIKIGITQKKQHTHSVS